MENYFNHDNLMTLVDMFLDLTPFKIIIAIFILLDLCFIFDAVFKCKYESNSIKNLKLKLLIYGSYLFYIVLICLIKFIQSLI